MTAIAAVDVALWDIKAKTAGMPLYQLLGGASRKGVMVYGHANGTTIDETIEQAQHYRQMGYKAIRLQSGVPGLPTHLRGVEAQAVLRTRGQCATVRERLVDHEVPSYRSAVVRRGTRSARMGCALAA